MLSARLLPQPKRFESRPGSATLDARCNVLLATSDERLQRAVRRWQELLPTADLLKSRPAIVRIAVEKSAENKADSYRLTVTPDAVAIVAVGPAGCFHALQTLEQLRSGGADVPCCTIEDWADFRTRGLLHDVSRGKVPTLGTLKLLADRLASLKVNQLQLYIEHAFTFEFDPEICGPDDGLTPDEVRELDDYCRDRFIDLVPAVATLGHMGKILTMPKYRHLAEIEPVKPWDEMDWPQRARGFTLDIANPQSIELVGRIWGEILEAFSGPVVNICGDEPWDLGKGKNRERFASGVARPYIDHILRTYEICASRGRQVQVWSDVICKHPEQFGRLPKDLTALHWGYDDQADYEGTGAFLRAGLDTIVCPGISGWKRILPAMFLAERNIATFAAAGRRCGAKGLINTDWGDHGHFHTLGSSWHGIALGAACAWTADHPLGSTFDEHFAQALLGLEDATLMSLLRRVSAMGEQRETWRLFWQPVAMITSDSTLPTIAELDERWDAIGKACAFLQTALRRTGQYERDVASDLEELLVACQFTALFAGKARFTREQAVGRFEYATETTRTELWSDLWLLALHAQNVAFAECWKARNKPSGLMDIRRTLAHVADDVRLTALRRSDQGIHRA